MEKRKVLITLLIINIISILIGTYNIYKNYYCISKIFIDKKKIFYGTNDFSRFSILENNWEIIRNEIPKINKNEIKHKHNEGGTWKNKKKDMENEIINEPQWIYGWNKNWYNYPIIVNGEKVRNIKKKLPNTIKILDNIKGAGINVAGFTYLDKKSELKWHYDETGFRNNSLAMNLCLYSSGDSILFIKNRGKIYNIKQKKGKVIIFNSNNYHKVENYGGPRIILYIDFKLS
jgi:hypothetical protein